MNRGTNNLALDTLRVILAIPFIVLATGLWLLLLIDVPVFGPILVDGWSTLNQSAIDRTLGIIVAVVCVWSIYQLVRSKYLYGATRDNRWFFAAVALPLLWCGITGYIQVPLFLVPFGIFALLIALELPQQMTTKEAILGLATVMLLGALAGGSVGGLSIGVLCAALMATSLFTAFALASVNKLLRTSPAA